VSVLKTRASSSMTRIVNRSGSDGAPLPGTGLAEPRSALGTRVGSGVGQHPVDDLPYLAQVEGLQKVRCAGPFEELTLLPAQDITGDEDDSTTQPREPPLDFGVEVLAVELGHLVSLRIMS